MSHIVTVFRVSYCRTLEREDYSLRLDGFDQARRPLHHESSMVELQRAQSGEFFAPNLRVYRPWSRATAAGDAFAVLCMTFDEVTQSDRLLAVHTPVASSVRLTPAPATAISISERGISRR